MLQHTAQLSITAPFICTKQETQTLNPPTQQSEGWVLSSQQGFTPSQRLCGRLPLNSRRGKLKSNFYPKSQTQSEDSHELEQQPQFPSRELRDQEVPAPRHSEIPTANPNSANKGHTSPFTIIFKSSLLCRAILHPPSLLIGPDLQMSASFRLSQHNCHI